MSMFTDILRELDYPPVFLVPLEQFERVDGTKLCGDYGMASDRFPIITLKPGLRNKVRSNVIYHEIAHKLWPWQEHWWIECFAERMARGGGRGYWSQKTGHTVDDMPTRARLLELARRASARMREG